MTELPPTPPPPTTPPPPPTPTPTSPTIVTSLVLIDLSNQEIITVSFNPAVNLQQTPGWSFFVSDPATPEAPIHAFSLPLQVSRPPISVAITLIRGGNQWATLTWRQEQVTALPLTTTSSSAGATSTQSTPSSTKKSSAPPASSTSEPPGISPGAAAGLGIGSAIAGGLAVFLVGLCYMKKARQNTHARHKTRTPSDGHKEPPKGELRQPLGSDPHNADSHELVPPAPPTDPQPIDGQSLRSEALELESSIEYYVTNYLSAPTAVQPQSGDENARRDEQLSQLAKHEAGWHQLFLGRGGQSAWHMFISRVLAARIRRRGDVEVTLLPVDALRRYKALTNGSAPRTHYYAWCEVQARMMAKRYPIDSKLLGANDERNKAVDATVRDVQSALGPFRHGEKGAEPEYDSLRRAVVKAALFGWRLFSQADVTELFWSDSPGAMEVSPGVRRTIRDGGRLEIIQGPSQ